MFRLLLVFVISFVGCTKERASVTIDGVSVTVPADFIPMDEERVAALRDAAKSASPDVEVSMVGRRPPGAPLPWMYVQRSAVRPNVATTMTVGQVLDATLAELHAALEESGLEVISRTTSTTPDSVETCFATRTKKNAKALNHSCLRLWVAKDERVVTVSVVCVSQLDDAAECQRVLESRRVTPSNALPREQTFGSTQR